MSHHNGLFDSYFPESSLDQPQPSRNTKSSSRMAMSSHLQSFNIPDEFRQAPSAGFGELLGSLADHGKYTKKMLTPQHQSSRSGALPPPRFNLDGMRQVDQQMIQNTMRFQNNHVSEEQTDIDNLMEELLNDVEDNSSKPRDSNSNSIVNSPTVKEETDLVKIENLGQYQSLPAVRGPALDQLGLHSEINIKPEWSEEEKKPSLTIRTDIFQSNQGQVTPQPNMMQDYPADSPVQRRPVHYGRYSSRRSDGVPLYDDPTLPPGWRRTVSQRKTGATAGGWDTYILAPLSHNYKRFRSKQEVRRYFEKIGEQFLDWRDFDFNPFGSKGQHEILQEIRRNENMVQNNMVQNNMMFQAQGISHQQHQQHQHQDQLEIKPDISSFLSCELKQEID